MWQGMTIRWCSGDPESSSLLCPPLLKYILPGSESEAGIQPNSGSVLTGVVQVAGAYDLLFQWRISAFGSGPVTPLLLAKFFATSDAIQRLNRTTNGSPDNHCDLLWGLRAVRPTRLRHHHLRAFRPARCPWKQCVV